MGSNYIPASAINELEMWQADTFDPRRIDLELGWAESIGLNTMRVFLRDLPWQQDATGFQKRIDTFLQIADKHHITPLFVLFDSCWIPIRSSAEGSHVELEPRNKVALVLALLPQAFRWAREAHPTQPLTSGVWKGGWSSPEKLHAMERIQIEMSDVISFRSYDKPEEF